MKRLKKILKYIIISFSIYIIFFGVFILKFLKPKSTNVNYDINKIHETSNNDIYANIIETSKEALDIRLNLILKAKESINISSLNIYSDESGILFYGALLLKADEGVKINIIVDGFNLKKDDIFKVVSNHENINYYIYEPINILNPMTINNTLHDKIITIDNNYSLLGGRNISNKYLKEDYNKLAYDRDILLYNENNKIDTIDDMNNYLNELYNSKYTKLINIKNSKNKSLKNDLINEYKNYKNIKEFNEFKKDSIKVDNATFIRSPLNRGIKEPVLFNVIEEILKDYNNITYQTPYITTSKLMKKTFNSYKDKEITFITNNMTTNPNIPALSNYVINRKKLAESTNLYELQKSNSMHAKSITIGDDISIISSLNLDNRSMFLSTESMIVVKSKEFNEALNDVFNNLINESLLVNSDGSYVENDNVQVVKKNDFKIVVIKIISLITRFTKEILSIKI